MHWEAFCKLHSAVVSHSQERFIRYFERIMTLLACRRHFLAVSLGLLASEGLANADQEQDSLYTLGEINGVLNACPLNSLSCVSTQNDDQDHFIPPWQARLPMPMPMPVPHSAGSASDDMIACNCLHTLHCSTHMSYCTCSMMETCRVPGIDC